MLLLSSFSFISCGEALKKLGINGPTISLEGDSILVSIVFEKIKIKVGGRAPIPRMVDSYIEISPDITSGGAMLAYHMSLRDVLLADISRPVALYDEETILEEEEGNIIRIDPRKLPGVGNRPLPGLFKTHIPIIAYNFKRFFNTSVYLGINIFAIFVPVKLKIKKNKIYSINLRWGGYKIGKLSFIGPDSDKKNSGLLILFQFTGPALTNLKQIVDQYSDNYNTL